MQAEDDVGAMTRRIRLLEEDYEQTSSRLTTASSKLEEASKFAEESERYVYVASTVLIDGRRLLTVVSTLDGAGIFCQTCS